MTDEPAATDLFEVNSDEIWEKVGNRLESFIAAWEQSDEAPPVSDHINDLSGFVRRLTLIELIKVDLEQRWTRNRTPLTVEDYANRFPDLSITTMPADLIFEEFHVRRRMGNDVDSAEYLRRFPNQSEELRRLLEIEDPLVTTAAHRSRPANTPRVGEQLDDFELLTKLGEGAFASVFLARQHSMQRLVALKVSADHGHEPQTLAKLDHPHIVRVYDQKTLSDRRLRLLYMQHVAGGTLQDTIRKLRAVPRAEWSGSLLIRIVDQALDDSGAEQTHDSSHRSILSEMTWPEVVCHLGSQLADALHYAHGQGVLHRDLKPANILLSQSVSPKLVDFNISSCSKVDGASPAAYFGGSLAYMSPEHLEASNPLHDRIPESLDARTDVYALGVVLWELLTGSRPFCDRSLVEGWAATTDEMARRRQDGIPIEAYENLPLGCPSSVCEVLDKSLYANPEERYGSAAEMAAQLSLCNHPEALRLLTEPRRGLRWAALKWPAIAIVLTVILPNALAGWFNYHYNHATIIDTQRLAKFKPVFEQVQFYINSVAYPLGLVLGLVIIRSVRRGLNSSPVDPVDVPRQRMLRFRCLKLGHYLALLGIFEWMVAGVVYPVVLRAVGVPLKTADSLHFFASLALCGLIAGSYPFFGGVALGIDVFYPALIRPHSIPRSDIPFFAWLHRMSWRYLIAAAGVPLVALLLLILFGDPQNRDLRTPLLVLFAGGTVLFVVIFRLARRVQRDLSVLTQVAMMEKTGETTGLTGSSRVAL